MAVRIQFRRGTAAEWTSANPTLAAGELGYEVDTAKFKLGDGSSAWTALAYGGINQADIDAAIANVIDTAPGALDTLNELAAAINDDASFFNTITTSIATAESNAQTYAYDLQGEHSSQTTNVHGISNTANLVYASQITDLASQIDVANAVSDHNQTTTNVHGIANTAELMTSSEITNSIDGAISVHESETLSIHGIANTALLATSDDVDTAIATFNLVAENVHGIANTALLATTSDVDNAITGHDVTTNVHGIANTALLVTTDDLSSTLEAHNLDTTNVHGIANTAALATTENVEGAIAVHSAETTNVHGIANTALLVTDSSLSSTLADYALTAGPTFTGTVSLPTSTSIGDVSSDEISYLDGVTSDIQTQLDAKLATSSAASIYAPLSGPTFTGTVSLPSTTSIGDVSATEIGYVNGVTSGIQTQIDAKAPIASPTFTGTVSGVTAEMVGLGNVSNTADADKPVSTATQTALDLKADLSGATFTGEVEATDLTVTGNLIVQGTTSTISTSDLKVKDNMIYLNQAGASVLSGAVGDGTNVIYTTTEAHGYDVGDDVTVANTTPSSFDIASPGYSIIAVTETTFTVASTVTDTYVSGGNARGKVHSNPDLGWAAGRYDGSYAHAGVFRDATDGVFKFFDGYVPEPDESVFIDTSDNTFALADVAVAGLAADSITFADGTVQTGAGVTSITGFTEKTASYQLDTLDHKDNVVEMNSSSATTFTIPLEATFSWPVGASMDIIQTGTGQVTIAIEGGGTLNFTPGNKLRTQWSSCTIMKRATDSWILYGDLTA